MAGPEQNETETRKRIAILLAACFCLILSIVYFQYSKTASHYFGIELEVTDVVVNATHYKIRISFHNVTQPYWFNKWGILDRLVPFQEKILETGDSLTIIQGYEGNQTLFQNGINEGKFWATLYFRDSDSDEYSIVLKVKKGFHMIY